MCRYIISTVLKTFQLLYIRVVAPISSYSTVYTYYCIAFTPVKFVIVVLKKMRTVAFNVVLKQLVFKPKLRCDCISHFMKDAKFEIIIRKEKTVKLLNRIPAF